MPTINIDQLADEVVKQLNAYTSLVSEGIEKSATEVANKGVQELKNTLQPSASAMGSGENYKPMQRRTWNKYAKGWAVKDNTRGSGYTKKVIWNSKNWQLTHLLEFGHATRNGGRTRAFAHIKPVEEEITKEYTQMVEEIIKKGGKE